MIMSWLFTAWWSTWPGNHLQGLCVAELVGSCIPIHAYRCLPDPKCLFYPSGLLLCLSVDHFCFVPVDDMVLICDGWLVSYTAFPCLEAWVCVPAVKKSTSFCVPWSWARTSCLSLQCMSWSSSCKAHNRSVQSSLHPWPCHLDEPQSSIAFSDDGCH